MKKILVLGGGLGGLSVAWMLARTGKFQVTVVEKESSVGGLCGMFKHNDFYLDYGPHKSYSVIPGVLDEFVALMGKDAMRHKKKQSIYLFGQYLNYPMSMSDLISKMGFKNLIHCGIGALQSKLVNIRAKRQISSYEDFIIDKFGHNLYELVFRPLADKVWGDPQTLSEDIARTRIPSNSILDVLVRISGLKKERANTDAEFFYYPKGGFGRLAEMMSGEIIRHGGRIIINAAPQYLETKGKHINKVMLNCDRGKEISETDFVISTIHLKRLLNLFSTNSEINCSRISKMLEKLEYRSLILVYIFLNKEKVTNDHWIFFPDNNLIFSRIFEQKNMDTMMGPKDKTVICCDFTDYALGRLYMQSDVWLAKRCILDLTRIGLIQPSWVEETLVKRSPEFYPRYSVDYKSNLKGVYEELQGLDNLLLSGRIGFYNYNNSDHCLDMGKFIADRLIEGDSPKEIWQALERRVSEYRIVD